MIKYELPPSYDADLSFLAAVFSHNTTDSDSILCSNLKMSLLTHSRGERIGNRSRRKGSRGRGRGRRDSEQSRKAQRQNNHFYIHDLSKVDNDVPTSHHFRPARTPGAHLPFPSDEW